MLPESGSSKRTMSKSATTPKKGNTKKAAKKAAYMDYGKAGKSKPAKGKK